MFHTSNSLYFGRKANGAVRIIQFVEPLYTHPNIDQDYPMASFEVTIPALHWASIVASMSIRGESDGRFYQALDFHNEV